MIAGYSAILWDNDGVLVDTERLYYAASRNALAKLGINLNKDDFRRISLTAGKSVFSMAEDAGVAHDEICELRKIRDLEYKKMIETADELLIPGAKEVLYELRRDLAVMGIVSNSLPEHFAAIHQRSGILDLFDFYLVHGDYSGSKPEPAPYLAGLDRAGFPQSATLVVEDTPRGMASAKAAGIDCVVIPHELSRGGHWQGAAAILENITELPEWLRRS